MVVLLIFEAVHSIVTCDISLDLGMLVVTYDDQFKALF